MRRPACLKASRSESASGHRFGKRLKEKKRKKLTEFRSFTAHAVGHSAIFMGSKAGVLDSQKSANLRAVINSDDEKRP